MDVITIGSVSYGHVMTITRNGDGAYEIFDKVYGIGDNGYTFRNLTIDQAKKIIAKLGPKC